MIRFLLGGFVVAHGLVTAAIWVTPAKGGEPFRATHSWLLGDARSLAVVLALVVAAGSVLAGFGYLAQQSWWEVFEIGRIGGARVDGALLQPMAPSRNRHQRRRALRRCPGS